MRPPQRIQLSRARGWKMPAGAKKVDRTTRWGNPFRDADRALAARRFESWLRSQPELIAAARVQLAGCDLACWCPLDGPCHAEVWLRVLGARGA